MKRNPYFLIIHSILLLVVLVGFAPSFYLRPLGEQAALPLYLLVHGFACTAWFVVAFLQSWWINSSNLKRHRRLGLSFCLLAPVVSISGAWVMAHRIREYVERFGAYEATEASQFESMLIWGDSLVLLSFFVLVYLGYQHRQKLAWHKRYMMFASVMIVPQAFVRLGKFPFLQIGEDPGASGSLYAVAGPVLILLSLLLYDYFQLRKVHRASLIAWGWYIGLLLSAMIVMRTGIGVQMLEWLR